MPTQFKTYDATAIREDLSDVIYDKHCWQGFSI
jgi:hypothetical protein